LEKDNLNIELKFDLETLKVEKLRLEKKMKELQQQISSKHPSLTPISSVELRRSVGSESISDLRDTIESLKRVIEKLKIENATIKKSANSNVKYMELINENKVLIISYVINFLII
jgi:hypothetical protein